MLYDSLPGVEYAALPREFRVQCAFDRGERVEVFDLRFRSQLRSTNASRADIGVDTQTSLLHADVAHLKELEKLLE